MREKFVNLLKSTKSVKPAHKGANEKTTTIPTPANYGRDQREHSMFSNENASIATYAMTDLFKPLIEVGATTIQPQPPPSPPSTKQQLIYYQPQFKQKPTTVDNYLDLEGWTKLGLFEKVYDLKKHDIGKSKDRESMKLPEINVLHEVTNVRPVNSSNLFDKLTKIEKTNKMDSGDLKSIMKKNDNEKQLPITYTKIMKKSKIAYNIACTHHINIPFEELTYFNINLLKHNSSCELYKHYCNSSIMDVASLASSEASSDTDNSIENSIIDTNTIVNSCVISYIKSEHDDDDVEVDDDDDIDEQRKRNKIQVKFKNNEKNGFITIVENVNKPIDYILIGKLICYLLGIENINNNDNNKEK